jgi:integrase
VLSYNDFRGRDQLDGNLRGWSHQASGYLTYLSLVHGVGLDYELLLGRKYARLFNAASGASGLGVDLDLFARHVDRLTELGYAPASAASSLTWGLGRLVLHRGDPDLTAISYEDLLELCDAVRTFADRADFRDLRRQLYAKSQMEVGPGSFLHDHLNKLHSVHVLLFNIGQVTQPPTRGTRRHLGWADRLLPEPCPPAIRTVVERYLRHRLEANLDRPQTVHLVREGLRRFVNWLTAQHPAIVNLTGVDRGIAEEYLRWLPTVISKQTGRPLVATTRKHEINALAAFFRDTGVWEWADVPGRPLLTQRDAPRNPQSVPRYLPRHELDALMAAVEELSDPMQRAALLLLRWSGARRDEIRRLTVDCLDAYQDGHPRLLIPVGKGHSERVVPLHPQAADALQVVIAVAREQRAHARHDPSTGRLAQYAFVRRGKLVSSTFLFDDPLALVCRAAGLVDSNGLPTVSAHRFRHTIGTQLAEGGARIQTIMSILGHRSANMSLIYSRISDPEVRKQYEAALASGARIAGPAADALLHDRLDDETVHWLKTNFLKTELELGHCLRLPAEGPCECELMLNCPKFVTTSDYIPRLRARLCREDELIEDANTRGWPREVERHQATKRRLHQLLGELESDDA